MNALLDTDRIRERYRQRRRWYLALTFGGIALIPLASIPLALAPRPTPGQLSLMVPVAWLLVIGATLLAHHVWRCPACQAHLPRGWEYPHYCPRCAVPLADPSERPGVAGKAMRLTGGVLLALVVAISLIGAAVGPPRRRIAASTAIARPTPADIAGLRRQIQVADYLLAQRYAGARLRGTTSDLPLLQRLLTDHRPEPDKEIILRCVGAAFGNVLTGDTNLRWVVVEDQLGRDLGLQYRRTSLILFPLTMVSKRVQAGEAVDLGRLYRGICAMVDKRRQEVDPEPASAESARV